MDGPPPWLRLQRSEHLPPAQPGLLGPIAPYRGRPTRWSRLQRQTAPTTTGVASGSAHPAQHHIPRTRTATPSVTTSCNRRVWIGNQDRTAGRVGSPPDGSSSTGAPTVWASTGGGTRTSSTESVVRRSSRSVLLTGGSWPPLPSTRAAPSGPTSRLPQPEGLSRSIRHRRWWRRFLRAATRSGASTAGRCTSTGDGWRRPPRTDHPSTTAYRGRS